MASTRRDHLVDTALKLFSRGGFHATGIDTILAEAGVAKMTLYNHFRSKEELILAALQRQDELFRNWFTKRVEQQAREPRKRLIAMFEVIEQWFAEEDFDGCMFINASAEYSDPANPIYVAASEHERLVLGYVRDLATAAGARDPSRLALELVVLMQGAIVWRQTTGENIAARAARVAAESLVTRAFSANCREGAVL